MVQEAPQTAEVLQHAERVQVQMQNTVTGREVRIVVERHDAQLGWYPSGSVTLPLHQLPLLEQAVAEMRNVQAEPELAEIIPFPGCEPVLCA